MKRTAIHLLLVDRCPSASLARRNLAQALRSAGPGLGWKEIDLMSKNAPAKWSGFPSPTILIDGKDVFSGSQSAPGRPACRLGRVPSVQEILRRLKA